MNPVVDVRSLQKSFGPRRVLDGVDWAVAPGRVVGLLGRNGAGKTTLLECLLGLRELDGGSAHLLGERADALTDAARSRIGFVPQQAELFEWLTPTEMLAYFRALYPRWNTDKVAALLDRWAIDPARPIGKLSGGERQRLSIVRALAHDPDLLVLDEPVASLDPAGRREFLRELVDRAVERDTTVVFSTHILSDLERVALDVAFLKDGRLALQAPLDELVESARRIVGPPEELSRLGLAGELARTTRGREVTGLVARLGDEEAAALAASHPALRLEPVGLEDLFIEVTR